jgi:hypothetical protein
MGSAIAGPARSVSIASAYLNLFMDFSRITSAPYAHQMNSNSLVGHNKRNRSLFFTEGPHRVPPGSALIFLIVFQPRARIAAKVHRRNRATHWQRRTKAN